MDLHTPSLLKNCQLPLTTSNPQSTKILSFGTEQERLFASNFFSRADIRTTTRVLLTIIVVCRIPRVSKLVTSFGLRSCARPAPDHLSFLRIRRCFESRAIRPSYERQCRQPFTGISLSPSKTMPSPRVMYANSSAFSLAGATDAQRAPGRIALDRQGQRSRSRRSSSQLRTGPSYRPNPDRDQSLRHWWHFIDIYFVGFVHDHLIYESGTTLKCCISQFTTKRTSLHKFYEMLFRIKGAVYCLNTFKRNVVTCFAGYCITFCPENL